jgi:hypothetical protein
MTAFVPASGDVEVRATLFDIWGHAQSTVIVSEGAAPSGHGDPVVAALPDGAYAVAWTDVLGDSVDLGIALRRVEPTGELQPLASANDALPFPQTSPDLIWTGQELVAAWVDYGDPSTGPDIHYKLFDANLFPLTEELVLADSAAAETDVTLTRFGEGWAAAFRQSGENREESLIISVGESVYTIGPFHAGGLGDHPALVQLDEQHLLAVFTAGPDDWDELEPKSELRYAVVDITTAQSPSSFALDPLDPRLASHDVSELHPAAERAKQGAYLAWTTTGPNGDPTGDQVWLKRVTWDAGTRLGLEIPEELAPRDCDENAGNQMNPALASTQLPPGGALVVNWDDYARNLTGAGAPDVVVHYVPIRLPGQPTASSECAPLN